MPAGSLLTLIDDISAVLDDVALLTKTAASKTSAVMGDDLALNAEQVAGVRVERELPVVWAVARGSAVNKLILVPAALLISAFMPKAIMPLMLIGGLFLCYEGFEKVVHKLLHSPDTAGPADAATAAAPTIDPAAIERDKIKGAVRTDFVLSAEIIVISLGTMATAPIGQQIASVSAIAIAATVLVYGLVAGIVKLDDLGLKLRRSVSAGTRQFGTAILTATPWLMKALSVLGTAAMFTVGGGIVMHGVPAIEHSVHGVTNAIAGPTGALAGVVGLLAEALVGIAAGGVTVLLMVTGKRVAGKK